MVNSKPIKGLQDTYLIFKMSKLEGENKFINEQLTQMHQEAKADKDNHKAKTC